MWSAPIDLPGKKRIKHLKSHYGVSWSVGPCKSTDSNIRNIYDMLEFYTTQAFRSIPFCLRNLTCETCIFVIFSLFC